MEYKGKITRFLFQSFGWNVKFEDLGSIRDELPFGLQGAAEYSTILIEDIKAVAVKPIDSDNFRGSKNLANKICKISGLPTVLILDRIDTYQRRSLIENRINFIVPEHQIYLPSFGILLNERGFGKQQLKGDELSSIATSIVIYHLNNNSSQDMSITELALRLGYSIKTLSLASSELQRRGLVTLTRRGRMKIMQFPMSQKQLWKTAYPLMPNPIVKRAYTDNERAVAEIGVRASDTAMAEVSMLAGPVRDVYAVYARDPRLKELNLNSDDGKVVVEVWKINPALCSKDGVADVYSLSLSYKGDDDPRISIELEKLLSDTFASDSIDNTEKRENLH